jgi:hypothetical protein
MSAGLSAGLTRALASGKVSMTIKLGFAGIFYSGKVSVT